MYDVERFETTVTIPEMMEKYYDYDVTLEKCRACSGFKGTWSCPDFGFDPADIWQRYSEFHFIVDKVMNEGCSDVSEAKDRLFREKERYDEEMLALENKMEGSRAIVAQECVQCRKCARTVGKPCAHPEKMRYALESLGMLAVKMVKDKLGFDILWSDGQSIPEYYLLVGGVLTE